MAKLLQRICWNSKQWQGPTGEMFGQEDSYVGKNGVGHEEWNLNTADLVDGKVYGYAYYNPPSGSPHLDEKHDIYFFTISPNKERVLVGFYKQARFLSKSEQNKIKEKVKNTDYLEKRIDEVLALDVPSITNRARAEEILLQDFALNLEVDPENVFLVSPPKPLTREETEGTDPKRINRYTNPKFVSKDPNVNRRSNKKSPASAGGVSDDLIEGSYVRYTKSQKKVIVRQHNQLSNRFRDWLGTIGAKGIRAEQSRVDVACKFNGSSYLFELKVCYQLSTRFAIREALGQLLEYRYYPGRPSVECLAIVIDREPSCDEVAWFSNLNKSMIPIELYWLKGKSVFSAKLTNQALCKKALKP